MKARQLGGSFDRCGARYAAATLYQVFVRRADFLGISRNFQIYEQEANANTNCHFVTPHVLTLHHTRVQDIPVL